MASLLFSFSACLRHAFMTGAGYGDLERISDEDQRRFCDFDPSALTPFERVSDALSAHDDMLSALREAAEILRHNPDASEPPRYRNARASKVIDAAIAKTEGRT